VWAVSCSWPFYITCGRSFEINTPDSLPLKPIVAVRLPTMRGRGKAVARILLGVGPSKPTLSAIDARPSGRVAPATGNKNRDGSGAGPPEGKYAVDQQPKYREDQPERQNVEFALQQGLQLK